MRDRSKRLTERSKSPDPIVFPLTTQLVDDAQPLRMRIKARDNLKLIQISCWIKPVQ